MGTCRGIKDRYRLRKGEVERLGSRNQRWGILEVEGVRRLYGRRFGTTRDRLCFEKSRQSEEVEREKKVSFLVLGFAQYFWRWIMGVAMPSNGSFVPAHSNLRCIRSTFASTRNRLSSSPTGWIRAQRVMKSSPIPPSYSILM